MGAAFIGGLAARAPVPRGARSGGDGATAGVAGTRRAVCGRWWSRAAGEDSRRWPRCARRWRMAASSCRRQFRAPDDRSRAAAHPLHRPASGIYGVGDRLPERYRLGYFRTPGAAYSKAVKAPSPPADARAGSEVNPRPLERLQVHHVQRSVDPIRLPRRGCSDSGQPVANEPANFRTDERRGFNLG